MRATTKHHCAECASDVHTFWPLITHCVAVERGRGRDVGQVAAGAGLGVALAPQLGDVEDLRQEPLLLLGGAEGDQRRPEQLLAEVVDLVGRVGRAYSSWKMTWCATRQPAAAVLLRPAEAGQPGGGEMPVPRQPFLERLVLAARAAETLERGELAGEVVGEPVADLGPERLDLYHPCRLTYQALALLEEHR